MVLPPLDPESSVSTSFTTWAGGACIGRSTGPVKTEGAVA